MQEESKNSAVIVGVVAVVVGLLVGFGVSALMHRNDTANTATPTASTAKAAPTTDTKSADLRTLLNALDREHVDLASQATRAGFDGSPDFAAAASALDANSNALSDAIGSVYGADARAKFYDIWHSHIGFFVDYTVAAKKGDKAGMDKAVQNLNGYVEAISTFLSSANPNLPKDVVAKVVTDHVNLLKGAVDAYGAKDYAGSFSKEHDANVQIGTIADAIAGAIVKQYPDKF